MSKLDKVSIAIGVFLIVLVVGYLVWFPNRDDTRQPVLKVGALLSLTGGFSSYGEDMRNALQIAVKDIEQKEHIKIELIIEDTASDAKTAVQGANKLINIDKVSVIIGGPGSTVNLAVTPLMQDSKTLFLVISSTPKLNEAGDYVFKFHPDVYGEVQRVTRLMAEKGLVKVALLYDQSSDTIVTAKDELLKSGPAAGLQVTVTEGFDSKTTTDFKTALSKLSTSSPEVLYVIANDKPAGLIIKQARELGMSQQIFTWSSNETEVFLDAAGPAAEGVIFTAQPFSCDSSDSAMVGFCKKYNDAYHRRPLNYGAQAYDILNIVAGIVKTPGFDDVTQSELQQRIMRGLTSHHYDGITGSIDLDDQGNVRDKDFVFREVKDGKFVELK